MNTTAQIAQNNGYLDTKVLPNGSVACIHPFLFTHAIIVLCADAGTALNSYSDRWCYCDYDKAKAALDFWDGTGEPTGWHRHPATGRRREKGDPATEYVSH